MASREGVRRWFHKIFSVEKGFRGDENVVKLHGLRAYVWSAVDVDSGELLALEASYGRSCLNAITFLKKALKLCIVDGGPWYRWALERLGIEYRVERFFRYLKERTMVFHHKMSARDHVQGIINLKLFLNLYTLYYQTIKIRGE